MLTDGFDLTKLNQGDVATANEHTYVQYPVGTGLRRHQVAYEALRLKIREHKASGAEPVLSETRHPTGGTKWQPGHGKLPRRKNEENNEDSEDGTDDGTDDGTENLEYPLSLTF